MVLPCCPPAAAAVLLRLCCCPAACCCHPPLLLVMLCRCRCCCCRAAMTCLLSLHAPLVSAAAVAVPVRRVRAAARVPLNEDGDITFHWDPTGVFA